MFSGLLAAAMLAAVPTTFGAASFQILASEGDTAAGQRPGETWRFETFLAAGTTPDGFLLFDGTGTSLNPGQADALWIGFPGAFRLVARIGDPAPDGFPARYADSSFFSSPVLAADRTAFFIAEINDLVSNFDVVVRDRDGTQNLIAVEGNVAPGAQPATFAQMLRVRVSSTGLLAFNAVTSDGEEGIWFHDSLGLRAAVLPGALVDGSGGAMIVEARSPVGFLDNGSLIFSAFIQGGPIASATRALLQLGPNGTIRQIVREGAAISSLPGFFVAAIGDAAISGSEFFLLVSTDESSAAGRDMILRGSNAANLTLAADVAATIRLPSGFTLRDVERVAVAPSGRLLIRTDLLAPAASSNSIGIFMQNAFGIFVPIIVEGLPATLGGTTGTVDFVNVENVQPFDAQGRILLSAALETPAGLRSFLVRATLLEGPPTVTIKGKRQRKTRRNRITVRGLAADDVAIANVRFQVRNGAFRPATGTEIWSARARLKPGRNRITVRATDDEGFVSAARRINVKFVQKKRR